MTDVQRKWLELEAIAKAGQMPVDVVRRQLAKEIPSSRELEERRGAAGEAEKGQVKIDHQRFILFEWGEPLLGHPHDSISLDAEVTLTDGTKLYGPEHLLREKVPWGPSPLVAIDRELALLEELEASMRRAWNLQVDLAAIGLNRVP